MNSSRRGCDLSEVSGTDTAPYHLINTAFNIQNSKTANKRGRNADFFLLSQNFVGSESHQATCATKEIERIQTGLDLGDRHGCLRGGRLLEHGSPKHQGADADPGDLERPPGLLVAQIRVRVAKGGSPRTSGRISIFCWSFSA